MRRKPAGLHILFDRNIPEPLRDDLLNHQVENTQSRGWSQMGNGDLLHLAESAGFDLMVTADQSIKYQQNLTHRKIALVVLGSNKWPIVRNHIPEIVTAVDRATPSSYTFIEMPLPPKSNPRKIRKPVEE